MKTHNRLVLIIVALAFAPCCVFAADGTAALRRQINQLELEKQELLEKLERAEKDQIQSKEQRLEPVATVLDRVMLRESVFDAKSIAEPARITYVRPGSGDDTYAIDAGVAFNLITYSPGNWQLDWRLGAEYHRDSAAASLKDVWTTGVLFDLAIGNPATSANTFLINGDIRYKDDTVADLRSAVVSLELLPIIAALKIDTLNEVPMRQSPVGADGKSSPSEQRGILAWRWQPFVGLLEESSLDTAANVEKGHQIVGRYGAEVQIFPLFRWVRDRVELTARYTAWSTLDSTGVYDGDDFSAFYQVGLKYWFDTPTPVGGSETRKKMRIGLGLLYENGDNPELSLRDTDQLTFSLTAIF
jgi:hypothetical protein